MTQSNKRPNIILINCDDMGYGDLGCYGSTVNETPHIDRMAKEGVLFTSWYAPSPVCSPSRGAMLTGCYPPRIGFSSFDGIPVLMPGQGLGLHPDEATIPKILQENGYATMLVGKWHCGDQPEFLPLRHGFDEYYGLPYSNDMGRQAIPNFPKEQYPLPLIQQDAILQQQPDLSALTERYTEKAVDFIRRNENKPFFLYFAHMYVHLPHYPPQAFANSSQNGAFGGCMAGVDWSVAVLRAELERLGLAENTLIVFTSDNGSRGDHGASNHPLRGAKTTTWEGGMRVPCLWYWPNHLPEGSVCGEVCSHLDLLPSFLSLAGVKTPLPNPIDGRNIAETVQSGKPRPESENVFFYYWTEALEAVRMGKWKLFVSRKGESVAELYDLEHDIGETLNVYSEYPAVVAKLFAQIEAMRPILGDSAAHIAGTERRPAGRVENPVPLTKYDEKHPYIIAMYDSPHIG